MGEHVAGSAEHVNMLGVARGDVYIRGYMAPIGAQWLIARSSRTVRTVTTVSCALTVSESLIKIDDVALEHCCSLGGPGARRGWRERRSEVVMYDIV
jgi:hypothetical protein